MAERLHFDSKDLYDPEVMAAELADLDEIDQERELESGGRFVAALLEEQLPSRGFPVDFIVREDWGWHVEINDSVCRMAVGCGYSTGYYGLHCFLMPEKPRLWHLFKHARVKERLHALRDAVEDILRNSGKVSGLKWLDD
jgi:hypothetical protein